MNKISNGLKGTAEMQARALAALATAWRGAEPGETQT